MRVRTSITLSSETLAALDRATGRGSNRSMIIEQAVREYLARGSRAARDRRDLDLLNRNADALNEEMADFLSLQADL